MVDIARTSRRAATVLTLALLAGCREKAAAPPTDSALVQDLAMAQREAPPQTVFNDAPVSGTAPIAPAPAAKTPQPQSAHSTVPRPTPRRQNPVVMAPKPSPRVEQPTPMPAEAPAPVPAAGVIGAGSRVGMRTTGRVCTASVLVGDKFTATVSSATVGSNGAVIPAGSTVVLEVASVDRADPIEASRIQFRVRSIDVNGSAQQADGDVATLGPLEKVETHTGNDRNKVIGGAVAGAVLGRIFGGSTKATVIGAAAGAAAGTVAAKRSQASDACLPEGSPLQLTLSRDLVMRRVGAI